MNNKALFQKLTSIILFSISSHSVSSFGMDCRQVLKPAVVNTGSARTLEDYTRAVVEENIADYIEQADRINARIKNLQESINRALSRFPNYGDQVFQLREKLTTLEVLDFESNIENIDEKLMSIEFSLDEMIEAALKDTRNENISDFKDLNNRWGRLIAGKKYNIEGVGYQSVVFTDAVINHFSERPLLGTRFLAAFSKSYVAVKGSTGLRRLPNIHTDFRDIKIIKSHGKTRIVGKLIGDTIHFFHIYESDKAYNTGHMDNLIENYQP